jgi:alpha-L-fucosidase 2
LNPFFAVAEVKQPLISSKANLNTIPVKKVYEYNLSTQPAKTYILKIAESNVAVTKN